MMIWLCIVTFPPLCPLLNTLSNLLPLKRIYSSYDHENKRNGKGEYLFWRMEMVFVACPRTRMNISFCRTHIYKFFSDLRNLLVFHDYIWYDIFSLIYSSKFYLFIIFYICFWWETFGYSASFSINMFLFVLQSTWLVANNATCI